MRRIDINLTEPPNSDTAMSGLINWTDRVEPGFSWTMDAQGGYTSASFSLVMTEADAWNAMNSYLGKRVVFTNPLAPYASMMCWEGRILTLSIDDGRTQMSRSLEGLVNAVQVSYAYRDPSTNRIGDVRRTSWIFNTASIALYGQRSMVYTVGAHASTSEANAYASALLAEYATPRAVYGGTRLGASVPSRRVVLKVDCVGMVEALSKRIYINATGNPSAAYLDHAIIIKTMLTSVGGGFISSDHSGIGAAGFSEYPLFNGEHQWTARGIIDALAAKGWNTGALAERRRAYFAVFQDRLPFYYQPSATPDYVVRKWDGGERLVEAGSGAVVMPWLVRPGKVLSMPDLLPDESTYATGTNPREFVIGQVRFTQPNSIAILPSDAWPGQSIGAQLGSTILGYRYW